MAGTDVLCSECGKPAGSIYFFGDKYLCGLCAWRLSPKTYGMGEAASKPVAASLPSYPVADPGQGGSMTITRTELILLRDAADELVKAEGLTSMERRIFASLSLAVDHAQEAIGHKGQTVYVNGRDEAHFTMRRHPVTVLFLNGERRHVGKDELTYELVARMAGLSQPSVTFAKGINGAQGTLLPGQSVAIVDGMVFNVCNTSSA